VDNTESMSDTNRARRLDTENNPRIAAHRPPKQTAGQSQRRRRRHQCRNEQVTVPGYYSCGAECLRRLHRKDKSKIRANTRLHPTPARIDSPRGVICSATRFAFADIRSRCTEVTAAMARGLIQTSKNPTASCAIAKHSKRKEPLTPVSNE
jgi:hypothetical protein